MMRILSQNSVIKERSQIMTNMIFNFSSQYQLD